MALPTILYNSTGSNTLASGAGPGTAVTGTNNATSDGATPSVIALGGSPDLSGVAVDGSHAIWLNTTAGTRHLCKITAKVAATSVTVEDTITAGNCTNVSWAIGGKRLTGEADTTRVDVADGKAGWAHWFEGSSTYDQSVAWVAGVGGATGGVTVRGDSRATRATLRQTGNIRHFEMLEGLTLRWLNFTTNNATNTATAALAAVSNGGNGVVVDGCVIDGVFNGISVDTSTVTILDTEIKNCVRAGVSNTAGPVIININGCYIHDNNSGDNAAGGGIVLSAGVVRNSFGVRRNIVEGNLRANVLVGGVAGVVVDIADCVMAGAAGTAGSNIVIAALGSGFHCSIHNNIITGAAAYGITAPAGADAFVVADYNAYYNNTSGARNNLTAGTHDVTLTGDPFTNAAAGDFSSNTTAGAGAACRATGYPGVFPGGLTTGYPDIGGVQHADPAGGAGGLLTHPGMSGRV